VTVTVIVPLSLSLTRSANQLVAAHVFQFVPVIPACC
jgi:hypothetical protein